MACSNTNENCTPKNECHNGNNGSGNNTSVNFVILIVLYILLAIILGAAIY